MATLSASSMLRSTRPRFSHRLGYPRTVTKCYGNPSYRDMVTRRIKKMLEKKVLVVISTSIESLTSITGSKMITYKEYPQFLDRCEVYKYPNYYSDSDTTPVYSKDTAEDMAKAIFSDLESCVQDYPERYVLVSGYAVKGTSRTIEDIFIAYFPS